MDALDALMPGLAQPARGLDPADRFFDALAPVQVQAIGLAAGCTAVAGTAGLLACDVGLQTLLPEKADKGLGVIALVSGHRRTGLASAATDHSLSGDPFGPSIGLGGLHIHDQAFAVLGQRMRQIAQLGFHISALLVEPRFGIGGALVSGVAARLSRKIHLGISGTTFASGTAAVLANEALVAGPGLDKRLALGWNVTQCHVPVSQTPVDAEVLVRDQLLPLREITHPLEEGARHLGRQQPIAVGAEHGAVPDRFVHLQTDEPAEQQLVVQLLDQQPLAAHDVENLQERRPKQALRENRWATGSRVGRLELGIHARPEVIYQGPKPPKGMILWHPAFQGDVAKHRKLSCVGSAHRSDQSRSTCGTLQQAIIVSNQRAGVFHQPANER